ncbi:hypothetical protein BU24DRAFT_453298 [Aaosphaeria arxii CBS 175.79]|uniref:Uncharacterized protein n=1 Tax=Aaosphaeria arxii CBS 175.79 TaxID=1450172 RepID=A0A6A5XJH5_9PLEO|nr:uncharacterized protein BU24DRAFT_453298 [Aaosphaeria arxii CBS 175.79]KAF2013026.1 hypothetical protein BU24DRAFT_453298 [Aaosphaeria arxii CBS 175.79]
MPKIAANFCLKHGSGGNKCTVLNYVALNMKKQSLHARSWLYKVGSSKMFEPDVCILPSSRTLEPAFLPGATYITTGVLDRFGFDLDVIGRHREISSIEETARVIYGKAGINVNIAVWNMHIPESHQFEDILESGLQPMGRGGGFRIVVFRGRGYIKNEGAQGLDNWRCSGNLVLRDNVITFKGVDEHSYWMLPQVQFPLFISVCYYLLFVYWYLAAHRLV